MGVQVRGRLDHVLRTDHPADAPPGHGIGLGHAVDDDAAVGEVRQGNRQRRELGVPVGEVLVDLVRDHPQPLVQEPPPDRLDLLCGVHRSGRVGRRAEQECAGPVGAGGLELLRGHLVALSLVREHLDGYSAGQSDRLRVGRPVRRREQHLVPGIEDGREGLVDRLFAPVRDEHLGRLHVVPGVAAGLVGDGLLELGEPSGRRVAVVAGVAAGLDGRLHDVVGGGEVRLAGPEADDRAAGGLEGFGLGVDGERRGLGDPADAGGDPAVAHGGFAHAPMLASPGGASYPGSARPADRLRVPCPAWWSGSSGGMSSGCSVRLARDPPRTLHRWWISPLVGMPAIDEVRRRALAQLAEHRSPKPKVGGSSPSCPATSGGPAPRRMADQ